MNTTNAQVITLKEFYGIAVQRATESVASYRSSLEAKLSEVAVQTAVTLDTYKPIAEQLEALRRSLFDIAEQFHDHEQDALAYMHGLLDEGTGALIIIRDSVKGSEAVEAYVKMESLRPRSDKRKARVNSTARFTLEGQDTQVVLRYESKAPDTPFEKRVDAAVHEGRGQASFYAEVMGLLDHLRGDEGTYPSASETFAIALSTDHLRMGMQQPRLFKSLSIPGCHPEHQSFVFVTDGGPDHIKITVQDRRLLKHGIVVHIEHIDRSETGDRSLMEAYRLPSHITAAKVRLHVGDLAPTSCFIGRPSFEGLSFRAQYPHDKGGSAFAALAREYAAVVGEAHEPDYFFNATLLKAAHQTASACTAMFEAGIVDAKIAIENMTEAEAIRFMRAVVANVRRDPHTQYLSAAFNIHRPIWSESHSKLFSGEECLDDFIETVIGIAVEGQFDKITLDGATERKGASIPIVDQLSHQQMLCFSHGAHEKGLLTYLSAGIDASNLHKAVYTGPDGLGIGFALHASGEGVIGALSIDKIEEVLDQRDAAEQSPLGRAAKCLAYLDHRFSEGSLTHEENELRKKLYAALEALTFTDKTHREVEDTAALEALVRKSPKPKPGEEHHHKLYAHAERLLNSENCMLAEFLPAGWQGSLRAMVEAQDTHGLRAVLSAAQARRHSAASPAGPSFSARPELSSPESGAPPAAASRAPEVQAPEVQAPETQAPETQAPEATSWTQLAALTAKVRAAHTASHIKASRVHQAADLSGHDAQSLLDCAEGRVFVGVKSFPKGVSEADLLRRGAIVIKPANYMPFQVGRTELYTAPELVENDRTIYEWYQNYHHGTYDQVMMALHDGVILDLLTTLYTGRKQVGIMGGHSILRTEELYTNIATLCRRLAQEGYVVATGGGPGAMEAANLGAHFCNYPDGELEAAIAILQKKPNYEDDPANLLPMEVRARWSEASELSLGIPTWLYGQEPPNLFCKYQAKFFSNAIREDVLVLSCNCGIIYAPGSAGTRTEIAQYAVAESYSAELGADFSKPMVFYTNYWVENTIYLSYLNTAQREALTSPRPTLHYANKLFCLEDNDKIVRVIDAFYETYYRRSVEDGYAPEDPKQREVIDYLELDISARAEPAADAIALAKRAASYRAVDDWVVRDEMVIGVGSGTTVAYVVDRLAQRVHEKGWGGIVCVPTSFSARALLSKYSDVLTVRDMLTETRTLDIAIDGADEVDACLRLIKGGGGALLHEQVVGQNARHYIVVADSRKDSDVLGTSFDHVPVEVQALAWQRVRRRITERLGLEASLRRIPGLDAKTHTPYVTDNGNYLLDVKVSPQRLDRATSLLEELHGIAGICAVGLFPHLSSIAYFGYEDEVVTRTRVYTSDRDMLISSERQQEALEAVLAVVRKHAAASEMTPVVEMDLDLTALMPYRRTIVGLMAAGHDYGITEFQQRVQEHIPGLPGYTAQAWNEWLAQPGVKELVAEYRDLPWEGSDEHKDTPFGTPGATVHSSFHLRFWKDAAEMADDIPTEGLASFEQQITEAGGMLVFVSGRWRSEMVEASYTALRRAGLRRPIKLIIGNSSHDSKVPKPDAQIKKEMQKQINDLYGEPVAYIDDRITNLDAVASLAGELVAKDFVKVVSCIPGYSASRAHEEAGVLATSNLFVERRDPRSPED